jgi:hypothetical protein
MTDELSTIVEEVADSSPEASNILESTVTILNILMKTLKRLGYHRSYFVATNPLDEYVMAMIILEDSRGLHVRFNVHYEDVSTYDVYKTTREILIQVDKSLTRIPKTYHVQSV